MKYFVAAIVAVIFLASFGLTRDEAAKTTVTSQVGFVESCDQINTDPAITSGTKFQCLDGKSEVILEAIRGPVLINVWGSWCPPCKLEMPFLVALAQTKKVAIVGINIEEPDMETPRDFVVQTGITWPNLFDDDGRSKGTFGFGVPVTWFIDASGKVTYRHIGVIASQEILFAEVEKYLGIKV